MIAALEMRALGLERSTPFAVDQPARRVREVACRVAMALAPLGLKEQRPPAAEAPERIVCPRAGRDQLSLGRGLEVRPAKRQDALRSEEHTSELQSLMRISYAVFCLKKKKY